MSQESVPPPEPVAQPPYQPPAGPPYASPVLPPKKNQTLKIVLIVLGALLVLCCIGALIAGAFGYKAFRDATGPAKSAVTGYYDDLKAGNYGSAYDRLCAESQEAVTREDFIGVQNLLPNITDYKITGVNVNNSNGKVTGSVNVTVTRERSGESTQTIELRKEGGDWKVCAPGP
jgi:hypothetical protein